MKKGAIIGAVYGLFTPLFCIAINLIAPGPHHWCGWLYPGSVVLFFLAFGRPSHFEVACFYAVSIVLNAIVLAIWGFLVGLIFVILFGKSEFIRTPD
jgi:hypothetical protein